jgi:hypothetical protein
MTAKRVNIEDLKAYIEAAFWGDAEIVNYFDPYHNLKKWEDASWIVHNKILFDYAECNLIGLEVNGSKVGYFVYSDNLLISFGINIEYRKKEELGKMWGIIKDNIGGHFQCVLFSKNTRAINFLNKCGMDSLLESVTILETSKN